MKQFGWKKRLVLVQHRDLLMRVTKFWATVGPPAGPPIDGVPCRDWQGATDADGYGVFRMGGWLWMAHELALTLTTGEVKAVGLDTCHSCHRRPCCEARHLRFDTHQSNVDDAVAAGRVGPSVLTDLDVEQIRIRRVHGAGLAVLADDFGVSASYISQLCAGRRRPNAPGPVPPLQGDRPDPNGRG